MIFLLNHFLIFLILQGILLDVFHLRIDRMPHAHVIFHNWRNRRNIRNIVIVYFPMGGLSCQDLAPFSYFQHIFSHLLVPFVENTVHSRFRLQFFWLLPFPKLMLAKRNVAGGPENTLCVVFPFTHSGVGPDLFIGGAAATLRKIPRNHMSIFLGLSLTFWLLRFLLNLHLRRDTRLMNALTLAS